MNTSSPISHKKRGLIGRILWATGALLMELYVDGIGDMLRSVNDSIWGIITLGVIAIFACLPFAVPALVCYFVSSLTIKLVITFGWIGYLGGSLWYYLRTSG